MDTSKEYIKMCEKAPKLQPHDLEFLNGDYVYYKDNWGILFNEYFYQEGAYNDVKFVDYENSPFRLHTQDQLQKMYWNERFEYIEKATDEQVKDLYFDMLKECYDLRQWYYDEGYDYDHLATMEQLWLAFVMKEKYNKTWNGENWTCIEK